jgi:hypothetical protein
MVVFNRVKSYFRTLNQVKTFICKIRDVQNVSEQNHITQLFFPSMLAN